MADITPFIDEITNAIKGEEVRDSIVNALDAMNSEIATLKDRVDELERENEQSEV